MLNDTPLHHNGLEVCTLAKQGDHALCNVRLSIRLSDLLRLNRLTYDLEFWYVGHHIALRSRVKVKRPGQGQMLGSRSKVKIKFLPSSGQY